MKARILLIIFSIFITCLPVFAVGATSASKVASATSDDAAKTDTSTDAADQAADTADQSADTADKKTSDNAAVLAGNAVDAADLDSDDFEESRLQSSRRTTSRSGLCKTIYLMYTRAEDILATLKEVFQADMNSGAITISQNAGTNAIILRTADLESPIVQDVIDVINSIDFHNGQVLVDVLVVELSISDDEIFNAEWKDLIRNPARTANTLINASLDHGTIDADDPTALAEGFKAFITSANKMKLFLNALNKKGKVHVVSSPHIVTANHREAVFKIGEKLPLIDSVRPSDAGPITTFNIQEVGLELTVTPHINRAGEIDMEVSQVINAVMQDSYDAKQGTARMTTREAKTNLTVSDNDTIVLGGFIENKRDRAEHRIPVLSNLPVIGKIFTSVKNTIRKTELMVFITPRILNNKEDADVVTKTMVSRTTERDKTFALLETRKKVESMLEKGQHVIVDRRSHGWLYGMNTPEIDELVWQVPPKIEADKVDLPLKGSAPFGFGHSRRLLPAPVRTYLKPSKGVVFKKTFEIDDPDKFRRLGVRVSCENAASVYLNGVLVDEDPMMKMKDGHDFEYWNRKRDDIPSGLLKKGSNHVVVFLGSEKEAADGYFDMMLIGHEK